MKFFGLFFITLSTTIGFSQNLVPNPGFEDTLGCPSTFFGIQDGYAANWFQPTLGTTDLLTVCAEVPQNFSGYQFPNSGYAYAGFITSCHADFGCSSDSDYREYLSVRLNESLEPGITYYCKISISRGDSSLYANNFGVLFSDSIHQENYVNLPHTPQYETPTPHINSLTWTNYSFSFVATGGEDFLTIGNFSDDDNSDSTYVGGGNPLNWEYQNSYYYVDDVCLSRDPSVCHNFMAGTTEESNITEKINLFPNPTENNLTIVINEGAAATEVNVYNMQGQKVLSKNTESNNSEIQLSLAHLPPALYVVEIISNSGNIIGFQKVLKK